MKLTINREEFLKGLQIAIRAVSSKSVNAVLNDLKLVLNEKGLFITGSNNDLTIETSIPYNKNNVQIIRNYKEGGTLLNAKIIIEIARKLEGKELTLDVIDSTIAIVSDSKSEFKLNCIRVEEYPDLDMEPNGEVLNINTNEFISMVNQTAFAASAREQRPILAALNLEANDSLLVATATDSARLARKELKIPSNISFVANIPARMIVEVSHLAENTDNIELTVSDKKAIFSFGRTVVATRLIAGDYPNTKNIIPRVLNATLQVSADDFVKAIERVSLLSIERENVVSLFLSEAEIEISSRSSQIGSASEKIEMFKYDGPDFQVSFNNEFVLSAIKALSSQDVVIAFVGEMKPFVVKNPNDPTVIQIVTPVRTY